MKNIKIPLLLTFGICAAGAVALPLSAESAEIDRIDRAVGYEFAFAVDTSTTMDPATDPVVQARLSREAAAYCANVAVPKKGITEEYCQRKITRAVNDQLSAKRTEDQLALAD